MNCPVCHIKRNLKEDIDSINNEGYCTTCQNMESYFSDDKSITEAEANAHGLKIVDENWFEQEQEN